MSNQTNIIPLRPGIAHVHSQPPTFPIDVFKGIPEWKQRKI
jgi:hypothetical protein